MFRFLIAAVLIAPVAGSAATSDRLPAYVLQLPASVPAVFVAETDRSALHRIVNGPQGMAYVDQRYMSIGENGVDKHRAWDRRTPLGIYFVNERRDTHRLVERYGPLAFPLDYPNVWDRLHDRRGEGIWIHGGPEGGDRRPAQDTDGCIALQNDDLVALAAELVPGVTPVIVTRDIRWASPSEVAAERAELAAALEAWAGSIRSGDLYRYLSLYALSFRYRGMSRDEWMRYRLGTLGTGTVVDLKLDDILLLRGPEDDALYLSRFRQTLIDDTGPVVTVKRLYWQRGEDGGLRIVAEDNG
jgi:murein L,D-transpeptidase YafK